MICPDSRNVRLSRAACEGESGPPSASAAAGVRSHEDTEAPVGGSHVGSS